MIEQHYSCSQLAARLGVSKSTVHRAITEGHLGAVSFGHRLLIPESSIIDYLETHRLGPARSYRSSKRDILHNPQQS